MDATLEAAASYDASSYTDNDVRRALSVTRNGNGCSVHDFGALLSPAALPFLEEMALLGREEKKKHFGNSVYLFTPLYVSNYCDNACVYCGFNHNNSIRRSMLDLNTIESEMKAITATGLEEILILTGESPGHAGLEYIAGTCALARKYFRVIGLEVYPMDSREYASLKKEGVDFITVFQETYDPALYTKVHPSGRKSCFPYRFNTQERALIGGIRGVAFGSLLGLGDYRQDIFATGVHADLIQRKYPHAEISFSCPRLRPVINNSQSIDENRIPNESELLQMICALRLFMPFAGITISSRESARFRDNTVDIAATKISAGVDVGVGGHAGVSSGDAQFEINDSRGVDDVYRMLLSRGLQPVLSDYIYV